MATEVTFGRWFRFLHWLAHKRGTCDGLCSHCYHEATVTERGSQVSSEMGIYNVASVETLTAEVERLKAEREDYRDACAQKQEALDCESALRKEFQEQVNALSDNLRMVHWHMGQPGVSEEIRDEVCGICNTALGSSPDNEPSG